MQTHSHDDAIEHILVVREIANEREDGSTTVSVPRYRPVGSFGELDSALSQNVSGCSSNGGFRVVNEPERLQRGR